MPADASQRPATSSARGRCLGKATKPCSHGPSTHKCQVDISTRTRNNAREGGAFCTRWPGRCHLGKSQKEVGELFSSDTTVSDSITDKPLTLVLNCGLHNRGYSNEKVNVNHSLSVLPTWEICHHPRGLSACRTEHPYLRGTKCTHKPFPTESHLPEALRLPDKT